MILLHTTVAEAALATTIGDRSLLREPDMLLYGGLSDRSCGRYDDQQPTPEIFRLLRWTVEGWLLKTPLLYGLNRWESALILFRRSVFRWLTRERGRIWTNPRRCRKRRETSRHRRTDRFPIENQPQIGSDLVRIYFAAHAVVESCKVQAVLC